MFDDDGGFDSSSSSSSSSYDDDDYDDYDDDNYSSSGSSSSEVTELGPIGQFIFFMVVYLFISSLFLPVGDDLIFDMTPGETRIIDFGDIDRTVAVSGDAVNYYRFADTSFSYVDGWQGGGGESKFVDARDYSSVLRYYNPGSVVTFEMDGNYTDFQFLVFVGLEKYQEWKDSEGEERYANHIINDIESNFSIVTDTNDDYVFTFFNRGFYERISFEYHIDATMIDLRDGELVSSSTIDPDDIIVAFNPTDQYKQINFDAVYSPFFWIYWWGIVPISLFALLKFRGEIIDFVLDSIEQMIERIKTRNRRSRSSANRYSSSKSKQQSRPQKSRAEEEKDILFVLYCLKEMDSGDQPEFHSYADLKDLLEDEYKEKVVGYRNFYRFLQHHDKIRTIEMDSIDGEMQIKALSYNLLGDRETRVDSPEDNPGVDM